LVSKWPGHELPQGIGNRRKSNGCSILVIELRLTNASPTKIINFRGWQHGTSIVEDEHGNRYGLIDFGVGFSFGDGLWDRWNGDPNVNAESIIAHNLSLHPRKSYITYLFCKKPTDVSKEARMTLPSEALGGTGTIRLRVPIFNEEVERQREAERLRLETEQKGRELRERREREAKERAEEVERRRLEELREEAERKAKLERDEKEASEPLKMAKKLLQEDDVYRNDKAAEAWPILEKIIKEWPGTEAVAEAKRLLPPVRSPAEQKRDEETAAERLSYAKKLIDKGNDVEARTRLEKLAKELPHTKAAKEARMLLRELGK
jgi:hypothetical protein